MLCYKHTKLNLKINPLIINNYSLLTKYHGHNLLQKHSDIQRIPYGHLFARHLQRFANQSA